MKMIRLFAVSMFLAAVLSVSAFGQTATKIGVVNTYMFEADGGITKYMTVMKQLAAEFKPTQDELQSIQTRGEGLTKEYQTLLDQYNKNPAGPVSAGAVQAKRDEIEKLQREGKYKSDDLNAKMQARYGQIGAPIMQDIMKALQEYAKSKAFTLIFDAGKLDESNLVVAVGDDKIDVTKDFIAYYNAKQVPAPPK